MNKIEQIQEASNDEHLKVLALSITIYGCIAFDGGGPIRMAMALEGRQQHGE